MSEGERARLKLIADLNNHVELVAALLQCGPDRWAEARTAAEKARGLMSALRAETFAPFDAKMEPA
jgi:hypothetical protein